MPNAKTLAVGLAIVTILGFTVAMAVPMGPSFSDDNPENSGVTSAQQPGTNETGNQSQTSPNGSGSGAENGSAGGNGSGGDAPDGNSSGDAGSGNGNGSAGDQDGEKNKDNGSNGDDCNCDENGTNDGSGDDSAGDQDGSKDKGDDGNNSGDGSGDDGTGGDGTGDDDSGDNGNNTNDGTGDDGTGGNTTAGTCTTGGLQGGTIAYQAFGTENESGPISSQIHQNEEQFQDGQVLVHEGSCIIATVDNNAGSGGGGAPNGSGLPDQDDLPGQNGGNGSDDGNNTDDGTDGNGGTAGTCTTGGLQGGTIAYQAFGTENESGPISSQIHSNEAQFQQAQPVVHEGSCVIATVDNNANSGGGGAPNGSSLPDGGNVPSGP